MTAPITPGELAFFLRSARTQPALGLYEALRSRVLAALPDTSIEVKKTQISFKNRRLFAAVSFAAVRRAAERPPVWLTLTFGLPYRLTSPRVDACVEVRPQRFTHHCLLGAESELDDELLGWIAEAAAFAGGRR